MDQITKSKHFSKTFINLSSAFCVPLQTYWLLCLPLSWRLELKDRKGAGLCFLILVFKPLDTTTLETVIHVFLNKSPVFLDFCMQVWELQSPTFCVTLSKVVNFLKLHHTVHKILKTMKLILHDWRGLNKVTLIKFTIKGLEHNK